MICAKNCEKLSKFVEVMAKILSVHFFLGHFGDDCTSQSLDWCKKPLFLTNRLAAASNKYITTTK